MAVAQQTFTGSLGSFTVPAGVKQLTVTAESRLVGCRLIDLSSGCSFISDQNGSLYSWGLNTNGQLGNNLSGAQSSPVAVVGGLTFRKVIAVGDGNGNGAIGITFTDVAYAWGSAYSGQLGTSTATVTSSPIAVVGGLQFSDIVAQQDTNWIASSVIGLTVAGVLYAWGPNTNGQLGTNNVTNYSSPTAVVGGLTCVQVVAGEANGAGQPYFMALTNAGAAYAWGTNNSGGLGLGNNTTVVSSPTAVVGGLVLKSLATASSGTIGLTETGVAYGWGLNTSGQLGINTILSVSSPVLVIGGLTFQKIMRTSNSTIGLTTSGQLYSWGANTAGQLGINSTSAVSSPTLVAGGLTFRDFIIPANNVTSVLALATNGTLYAWGGNSHGQLGNNTSTSVSSPVAVVGGLTWTDFIIDDSLSCRGTDEFGRIWAWGANANGQLGINTSADVSSPVLVVGGKIAGPSHSVASRTVVVVPGQSLPIAITPFYATIGGYVIGQRGIDKVIVQYAQ